MNATVDDTEPTIVYWHRELPPLEAELMAEHTVEANSSRVPGTIAHRGRSRAVGDSIMAAIPARVV